MKRLPFLLATFLVGLLLVSGCSSDPNVEGAKLDLRNKDYDRALENLGAALENNPQNAEALQLKGQVLQEMAFETEDPQEHVQLLEDALAAYNQAAEIDPELSTDITNRLQIAFGNEFNRGIQTFNRAQQDESLFPAAAAYFNTAATLGQRSGIPDSTLSGAYTNQAYSLINAGTPQEAIEPLRQSLDLGETSADTYVILADLYRSSQQYGEAIDVLEEAREMYPDNEDIAAQLLNSYVASGELDEAMAAYQQQVEADPNNKLYRYNYGSLLLEAERYDEAIEQLQEAVDLDPNYASAQYNLGASYVNKAVAVNERISTMDDSLRANQAELSQAEISEMEAEIEQLTEERRALFSQAISPLEQAKAQAEANGDDMSGICQALFSAYVQTGQEEKAESIAECAGYDLN